MGRPPIKRTKALAFAEEQGRLAAQAKAKDKESIADRLERLIPTLIHNSDKIIEGAAILGATFIVHDVIFQTEKFVGSIANMKWSGLIPTSWLVQIGWAKPGADKVDPTTEIKDDYMLWLIAFAIAYFAVKHGDDLLKVASNFFGIGVLAGAA